MRLRPISTYLSRRRSIAALHRMETEVEALSSEMKALDSFSKRATRTLHEHLKRRLLGVEQAIRHALAENAGGMLQQPAACRAAMEELRESLREIGTSVAGYLQAEDELRRRIVVLEQQQAGLHVEFVRRTTRRLQRLRERLGNARRYAKLMSDVRARQAEIVGELDGVRKDIEVGFEVEEFCRGATELKDAASRLGLPQSAFWDQQRTDALAALHAARQLGAAGNYTASSHQIRSFRGLRETMAHGSRDANQHVRASIQEWMKLAADLPKPLIAELSRLDSAASSEEFFVDWERVRELLVGHAVSHYEHAIVHDLTQLDRRRGLATPAAQRPGTTDTSAGRTLRWEEAERYARAVTEVINQEVAHRPGEV